MQCLPLIIPDGDPEKGKKDVLTISLVFQTDRVEKIGRLSLIVYEACFCVLIGVTRRFLCKFYAQHKMELFMHEANKMQRKHTLDTYLSL